MGSTRAEGERRVIVAVAPSLARDAADLNMASAGPGMDNVYVALLHPVRRVKRGFSERHHADLTIEQVERLSLWCYEQALLPPGEVPAPQRNRSRRLLRAGRHLQDDLRHLANHPAYLGHAVLGTDATSLPGWRPARAASRAYPTAAQATIAAKGGEVERVWLVPQVGYHRGQVVTSWSATTDRPTSATA